MIKRAWVWLATAFGILALIVQQMLARYRRAHYEAEAADAEDQADKVKEAGKRMDSEEVLRSFRRSTDK